MLVLDDLVPERELAKRLRSGTDLNLYAANPLNSRRLRITLCIIEAFQVVLLQRPPSSYATTGLLADTENFILKSTDMSDTMKDLSAVLIGVMNPHLPLPQNPKPLSINFCLSALAAISWHIKPRRNAMLGPPALWKRDLLELSLYRCLSSISSTTEADASLVCLFHMIFLNTHTNLRLIHQMARWEACRGQNCVDVRDELRQWRKTPDCAISLLHAKELVHLAKQQTVFRPKLRSGANTPTPRTTQSSTHRRSEPPHIAIAVYIATLTLWTAVIVEQKPDYSLCGSHLEGGIAVLSSLKIKIATRLGNILKYLSTNCREVL